MPAERLSDVLDTLIRQSFLDCQIERHDGETEPFDPITLFYSLIESEIDVRNATILFDIIVQKIEKNRAGSGLSRISHQDLHDRVASAILGYKHPLASFWLSNYEGMFAPEIDHADDTAEYIDARNAGILRGEIRYFLEGKRDGVVSDATVLRDITNRTIKLIKFCGFHKLRRDFVQLLLAGLSISSTKSFLPNIAISDKSFTERLD